DRPQLEQRRRLQRRRALAGAGLGRRRRQVMTRAVRVADLRRVGPGPAVVGRARQLRAPVAVAERGPQHAAVRIAGDEVDAGAGVAGELRPPATVLLGDEEAALAGADEEASGHASLSRIG